MKKIWLSLMGLTLAVGLAACGSSDDTSTDAEQEAAPSETEEAASGADSEVNGEDVVTLHIQADNFSFDQEQYEVPLGATVEITFENVEGHHEAVIEGYNVSLSEGEPVTFVADQAGEFELACSVVCGPIDDHENMVSKLVVTE